MLNLLDRAVAYQEQALPWALALQIFKKRKES